MVSQTVKQDKDVSTFGKIGGTTVSSIVEMNPWETPLAAYLKLRGEVGPTPDNVAMERGRRYEPIVADIFAGGRPEYRVEHNRQKTQEPELCVHSEYDYLIGHPDRLLYDETGTRLLAGLEIKTTNVANVRNWGPEGTDAVPRHYLIQCQWYAGLTKLPEWKLAVAFLDDGGVMRSYREYAILADARLFEYLVESAAEFWENNVVPGVAPEYSRADATVERWLNDRFPRNVEPLARATFDEETLMERYLAARDESDAAQERLEQATAALKLAIGDRDGLVSDSFGKVTWKRSKDSERVDYKAVCAELNPSEALLNKHLKIVAGTRRFETKGMKR